MIRVLAVLFLAFLTAPALAVEPGEALGDPTEEARARALMAEIRCLVCQAESVEASPAPFAAEVRALVREQVAAGRSDGEIKRFLTDRYGEEILYRPPLSERTWVLWLGPFIILILGGAIVAIVLARARGDVPADELSQDEETRLAEALKKPGETRNGRA